MSARLLLALILCKLTRAALRLLKRGGTALPGRLAMTVCPDILSRLSPGVSVFLITGTNGKTTTARMLSGILADAGMDCFANRSGSNLERGIVTEFAANACLNGRPVKKYAVIECDEGVFRTVCPLVRPKVAVVTNLSGDQLDRYGSVEAVAGSIRCGLLGSPGTIVCLNADCPETYSLSINLPNELRLFGCDAEMGSGCSEPGAARCPLCGERLDYTFRSFDRLGGFICRKCGWRRQEPDTAVVRILNCGTDSTDAVIRAGGTEYEMKAAIPGAYNLYNAAAAVTAAAAAGADAAAAVKTLASADSGFGRMESFNLGKAGVRMILVKNAAGCGRALDYLRSMGKDTLAVFCLNDNTADGTDVGWIWDADFECLFEGGNHPDFIVSGTRAEELRLRLKYCGADENSIRLIHDADALTKAVTESDLPVCILPNYTAMLPLRSRLSRLAGRKEFWE